MKNLRPRGLALSDTGSLPRSPLVGLVAVVAALAAVAALSGLGEDGGETAAAGTASRSPVERTELVCPQPTRAETATTWYSGYTPVGEGATGDTDPGTSGLLPLAEHTPGSAPEVDDEDEDAEGEGEDGGAEDGDEAEVEEADGEDGAEDAEAEEPDERQLLMEDPGQPVVESTKASDAPALVGSAENRVAPGWTVQQTTLVPGGSGGDTGRGLLGTACQRPDTGFWFAGASTVETRHDYVHLINPDDSATVVDIELYGAEGRIELTVDEGVTVPGRSTVPVRLATLIAEPETNLAVQVSARSGRIGAQIEVIDEQLGTDWLAPVTAPAGAVVLPGIPEDAETVRLVAFTPEGEDVTLSVQFAGPTATITPAGNESVFLRSGMVESIDLESVSQGEPGSLVLTPTEGTGPVVAAMRITRGEGDDQELAFVPATAPVERQATAGGNTPGRAVLTLTAPGDEVEVEVVTSPGTEEGSEVRETVTVPGGTTVTVEPDLPDDTSGRYAITVRPVRGGELYAARMLTVDRDDVPMFTVQALPDDQSTVSVPETGQDLTVLGDR